MEELQLFRGDTVLIKGKKRRDTVSDNDSACFSILLNFCSHSLEMSIDEFFYPFFTCTIKVAVSH